MAAFALTIFTGAFLLFQVQPLIGKFILPWFGGGPGVWTGCMLFFQVLLLGGYAYAHLVSRWLRPRNQILFHSVLVAASLACLPIVPAETWKPAGDANPLTGILTLLLATIGLPYFVLSTTGPLMQEWFRRANPGRSPYRLYALSNVGSLLALISYPFYFETHFPRRGQAWLWAVGLALYALTYAWAAVKLWRSDTRRGEVEPTGTVAGTAVPLTTRCLWLLLPACASVLLVATTNKLCQDVAVIPFLWVMPLAIYLVTFIISFDSPRWYRRFPFTVALIAALYGFCWAMFQVESASIKQLVAVYGASLFVCCMVCHGELYRLRPISGGVTGYYLTISAGGALGGLFVAVAAPQIFKGYYELHCGLMLCALLFLAVCVLDPEGARQAAGMQGAATKDDEAKSSTAPTAEAGSLEHLWQRVLRPGCWRWLGVVLPIVGFAGADWLIRKSLARLPHVPVGAIYGLRAFLWLTLAAGLGWWEFRHRHRPFRHWRVITCAWLALGCIALGRVLWTRATFVDGDVVYRARNFYGVLTIYRHFKNDAEDEYLLLQHGRITHGLQFTHPPRRQEATSYYGEGSGIALAVDALPKGPRRLGVVGLGTGTLSALSRPGDYVRIYEINPQVRELAWNQFSYLRDRTNAGTKVEVAMGDARLSMEREEPQRLDLLALDAFSSDAIPIHLLTREAFDLYQRHVQTNGIIVVHISNRYLDLEPVVMNLAREFHYQVSLVDWAENEDDWWFYGSTWMILTRDKRVMEFSGIAEGVAALSPKKAKVPLWTDDFASLFQILR